MGVGHGETTLVLFEVFGFKTTWWSEKATVEPTVVQ